MTRTSRRSPLARRLVPVAGLLLVTGTAVTGCGFDYATNRVNQIAMTADDRSEVVDVLGAVIVSAQPGSGTLVVTFVNGDPEAASSVDEVAAAGEPPIEVPAYEPVEIPPRDRAVLAEDGGITVTGDFVPGEVVPVSFTFGDGSSVELDVPTVPPCRQWEGLDSSADADALEPEAAAPDELPEESADPEAAGDVEADAEVGEASVYDCSVPETQAE